VAEFVSSNFEQGLIYKNDTHAGVPKCIMSFNIGH
jgi:hypothetical protein